MPNKLLSCTPKLSLKLDEREAAYLRNRVIHVDERNHASDGTRYIVAPKHMLSSPFSVLSNKVLQTNT